MELGENFELQESLLVELDPLTDGFAGVLMEIAPATGNRLLLEGHWS